MYKEFKNQAIALRKNGNTYSDINKRLKTTIPKSTLGEWFKPISFTNSQKQALKNNVNRKLKQAQLKSLFVKKLRKKQMLNFLAQKNVGILPSIDKNIEKIILSILYLGEGTKSKTSQNFSLGSSDPNIIKLYLKLLNDCFEIPTKNFRLRIQCRHDQNSNDLERYWANITNINKKQFYPTYKDGRTIGKKTKRANYKGVCVVTCVKGRKVQYELELLANSVIKYITKGR